MKAKARKTPPAPIVGDDPLTPPSSVRLPQSLREWVNVNRVPARRSISNEIVVCLEILKKMTEDPNYSGIVAQFRS